MESGAQYAAMAHGETMKQQLSALSWDVQKAEEYGGSAAVRGLGFGQTAAESGWTV